MTVQPTSPGAGLSIPEREAITTALNASVSEATRRAYRNGWQAWENWALERGYQTLPAAPEHVAAWLATSEVTIATLDQRIAALNAVHERAGHPKPGTHPGVKETMAGLRRLRRTRQRQAEPVHLEELTAMVTDLDFATYPKSVAAYRDAAILLIGFMGAFRRSELCSLAMSDISLAGGRELNILVRHSKTDQEGAGMRKGMAPANSALLCAPCAAVRWMKLRRLNDTGCGPQRFERTVRELDITEHCCGSTFFSRDDAPVFCRVLKNGRMDPRAPLGADQVAVIVKRQARAVGLDPTRFSGHSLRAGFVTEAFNLGASNAEIRKQTGHRSDVMLDRYNREHAVLVNNAVNRMGL